jgi:hypothetical protein
MEPFNPAANRPQLTATTTAHVPVGVRAWKAALLVQDRAVLKTPSVAFIARAFNISPYFVTKKLRTLGRKPRVYRKRLPFPPPSSSAPPAAPAFLSVTG